MRVCFLKIYNEALFWRQEMRRIARSLIRTPLRLLRYSLCRVLVVVRSFFLFLFPSYFFLSGILCGGAFGTGFPVFDASNVIQSTITAVESIVHTQQQVKQIVQDTENMVKNTTAPAAWLWGTASDSFMDIQRKIDELRNLRDNAGGIDAYLKRYGDVSWYRSSPCFGSKGCSSAEEKTLFSRRGESSSVQKKANETLLRTLDQQGNTISEDARELKNLQRQTQNASGSLDALGYNSQIEGQQAAQLLQIRSLMIAQQNAEVTRMQAVADREAQEAASAETLRAGDFQASPARRW